ncbi:hypothetical protein [Alkaliphilus crotonatoxidans]
MGLNSEIFKIKPVKGTSLVESEYPFDYLTLEEEERELIKLNQEMMKQLSQASIECVYRNVEDYWRIVGSGNRH